jgi:hypothetical protein
MRIVRSARRLAAVLAVLGGVDCGGAEERQVADAFLVGVGISIHDPSEAVDAMSRLGVQSMRIDAPWRSIETAPGRYHVPAWLDTAVDGARARGIEPVLILAYGHPLYGNDKPKTEAALAAFCRYAVYVAKHFEGRVRYFDLWNEWDAATGRTTPGTPEDYVALARRAYPALKAANADAVVLSGGIGTLGTRQTWIERFIAARGLEVVDGLSVHPYSFAGQLGAAAPEAAIAELDRLHSLAAAAGRPLPIYVTEFGYPTYGGRGGVTAKTQAAYLARFLLLASARPYVAGVWWYGLRDQGEDAANREHNFGVLDAKLRSKPAAESLRVVANLIRDTQRFREEAPREPGERRLKGERADGSAIVLAWKEADMDAWLIRDLEQAATGAAHPAAMGHRR